MNENVKNELDRIVSVLTGTGIVSRIFLFGSYATGEEAVGSDIDLCVLTPVKDRNPIDITVDLRARLYGVKTMALDLFTCNQDTFFNRAAYAGSLEHEIAKHGVTLYEHK